MRQEILHQHFLRHKILHVYFGVFSLFAIKNKGSNIMTQTAVMQKILMQKMITDKFDLLRGRLLGNHNDFH